jgi:hypothetical protein
LKNKNRKEHLKVELIVSELNYTATFASVPAELVAHALSPAHGSFLLYPVTSATKLPCQGFQSEAKAPQNVQFKSSKLLRK